MTSNLKCKRKWNVDETSSLLWMWTIKSKMMNNQVWD